MFRMQQRITEVTREKSLGKKVSLSSNLVNCPTTMFVVVHWVFAMISIPR